MPKPGQTSSASTKRHALPKLQGCGEFHQESTALDAGGARPGCLAALLAQAGLSDQLLLKLDDPCDVVRKGEDLRRREGGAYALRGGARLSRRSE
jgi:hypothetical protein